MAPGKRQGCAHRIVAVVTWFGRARGEREGARRRRGRGGREDTRWGWSLGEWQRENRDERKGIERKKIVDGRITVGYFLGVTSDRWKSLPASLATNPLLVSVS